MATILNKRLYMQVAANDYEEDLQAVNSGQDLHVYSAGGNACYGMDVKVELILVGETTNIVIFSTHGDDEQEVNQHYIPEESCNLKARLVNDTSNAETIGIWYRGDIT